MSLGTSAPEYMQAISMGCWRERDPSSLLFLPICGSYHAQLNS